MFNVLLLVVYLEVCLWKISETIVLNYKYSIGDNLTYSQIELIERHDGHRRIDETIEYIQMNFTDFIEEKNSIEIIKRKMNSIKILPKNDFKLKELFKETVRQIDKESLSKPIQLSTYNGYVLLLPRNEIQFPFDEIQINQTWTNKIENSLGDIQYKLKSIEQDRFAHIEYEGTLAISSMGDLIGNITFDIERGITFYEQIITSSSFVLDYTFTKTIIKRFLF